MALVDTGICTRDCLLLYMGRLPSYEIAAFRKPTPDDWYPTPGDGCVRIVASYSRMFDGQGPEWHIWIEGGDDFVMERWYEDESAFRRDLEWLSRIPIIRQADLYYCGFRQV